MAVYSRVLKVTSPLMRGEDVRAVQNKLNSLGYSAGKADGLYGNGTKNAVVKFQRAKGLSADGMVGSATWNKLFNSSASSSNVHSNNSGYHRLIKVTSPLMRGEDIRAVQNKLNSLGYSAGKADGLYGNGTKNAVVRFQSSKGLSADGMVGPATWNKLFNSTSSSSSSPKLKDITSIIVSLAKKYERDYRSKYSKLNSVEQLYVFYILFRNGGIGDLKNHEFKSKQNYIFNGKIVRFDAPANILYGYVGKAFGYPDQLLLRAAGYAQLKGGNHLRKDGNWYGKPPYGDDPEDQKNIKVGMDYYRNTH